MYVTTPNIDSWSKWQTVELKDTRNTFIFYYIASLLEYVFGCMQVSLNILYQNMSRI